MRSRFNRACLVTVLALCSAHGAGAAESGATAHSATGLSTQELEVLDWALALFDEAGLDLPGIDFVGQEALDACHGGSGLHRIDGGRSRVTICGEHPRRFDEILFLHEIAHAWDFAQLSDARRAAFAELRGLDQWWDDGVHEWDQRAAEHAAEIVTWALRDRPMQVITIPDADCASLRAGYLALTGRAPLHGYRDRC